MDKADNAPGPRVCETEIYHFIGRLGCLHLTSGKIVQIKIQGYYKGKKKLLMHLQSIVKQQSQGKRKTEEPL